MRRLLILLSLLASSAEAAYVLKENTLVDAAEVATGTAEEHFALGKKAMEAQDWKEAVLQFRMLTGSYPNSPNAAEAYFYLGRSYINLGELDFANEALSDYLKAKSNPRFFQEAVGLKFEIAEKF